MALRCTVCAHPDREAINAALIAGETLRKIAERTGTSVTALHRHKKDHLPVKLIKAEEAAEAAEADDLLSQIRSLQSKTLKIMATLETNGDFRLWLQGMREARGNIELLAKLTNLLSDRPTVNVLIAPEWLVVRAALMDTLRDYPPARAAVAERLALMEAGNGHDQAIPFG